MQVRLAIVKLSKRIYHKLELKLFLNGALERDLKVALIAVILIVAKTIPNMMKSSVHCKQIAGMVDAVVTALVFR